MVNGIGWRKSSIFIINFNENMVLFDCFRLSTGASWLCYYKALQMGPASVVVPIDKLSLVVTVIFSYFVFHEKLNKKSLCGFICLIVGTLLMLL
ncbi:EamA family transporter [Faecalibacillus faecis]|uniref:EamA family transporter n=2 Tax=Faecalibacillus faecis TaxID=1982628 RepID=UPI001D077ECB|nr:EamA family transporter [Faecalibacillus faecis]MCB7489994.1 EamA family transporter [Faecalibacillus faecis]MCG4593807.1 EamA family transporter [Faecalibacillus faecis]